MLTSSLLFLRTKLARMCCSQHILNPPPSNPPPETDPSHKPLTCYLSNVVFFAQTLWCSPYTQDVPLTRLFIYRFPFWKCLDVNFVSQHPNKWLLYRVFLIERESPLLVSFRHFVLEWTAPLDVRFSHKHPIKKMSFVFDFAWVYVEEW